MGEGGERPMKVRRLASSKPKLGRIVTVYVGRGDKARDFSIHDEILKQHSDFFKAALAGDRWQEGVERKVSLPEDDPETFEGFQCFIYSGKTFVEDAVQRVVQDDGSIIDQEYVRISTAWSLADKLQSCTYKDAVTDTLALKMAPGNCHPINLQTVLSDGTPASVGYMRLLIDIAVQTWRSTTFDNLDVEKAPKVFMQKLLKGLADAKDRLVQDKLWLKEDCHYHDHGEEKPCYKTMFTY
ncbi:hypothetical protein LTR27_012065 [Elasticomyces elasticus]|nr:hypothetical protein LTR27_012065 [Elasticomyces elasticus]